MTIPAKSPSSASSANSSSTKKIANPTKDQAYILLMKDITQDLLNQYFPVLKNAPNILYIAMATWGFESNFRMHHRKGGGVVDSLHLTPSVPSKSFVGKDYYFSQVIQNILRRNPPNPTTVKNVQEGLYPHGVSACMGCYHVAGTPANAYMFGNQKKIVSDLGLEVQPGQAISSIFPDNETGLRRSIAAGLIVYDNKYATYLGKGSTPASAIAKSIAAYVGKEGIPDNNNFKPEQRVDQLNGKNLTSGERSTLQILADIGLTPDNLYVAGATGTISRSSQASVKDKGTASNDQNRSANSTTAAAPTTLPGCSA